MATRNKANKTLIDKLKERFVGGFKYKNKMIKQSEIKTKKVKK